MKSFKKNTTFEGIEVRMKYIKKEAKESSFECSKPQLGKSIKNEKK